MVGSPASVARFRRRVGEAGDVGRHCGRHRGFLPLNVTFVGVPAGAETSSYFTAARASATRATSHGAVKLRMPTGSNTEPQVAGSATTWTFDGLKRLVQPRADDAREHAEQREVGDRRDQAAAQDNRLAADAVGQAPKNTKPPVPRISDHAMSTFEVSRSTFRMLWMKNRA